jgi:predicted acylesterase/phospholipase RssA
MSRNPTFANLADRPFHIATHTSAAAIRKSQTGYKPSVAPRHLVDGVFQGGGALGTAYVGALRVLHDNAIGFARVAGNSAGSITAAMIACGFTPPEIQWLCSAFTPTTRPSTLPAGIDRPIDFMTFLDVPSPAQVSTQARRSTLLWNIMKGTVIDEVAKIQLPIKSRNDVADGVLDAVLDFGVKNVPVLGDLTIRELFQKVPGNQSDPLKSVLVAALTAAGYPRTPPQLGDLVPLVAATAPLRTQLADTIWVAVAMNEPVETLITQFLFEGALFEGQECLNTFHRLFGLKMFNDADRRVYFSDLKIPLAVIGTNLETGQMEIYNSVQHPTMEVAEAVRRSMSIPFVFQPRGSNFEFVDGGLCSNFPVWLFSSTADRYWPAPSRDHTRPKIGFGLDQNGNAPSQWNVQPARFKVTGTPGRIDDWEVAKPILIEVLRDLHRNAFANQIAESERNRIFDDVANRLEKVVVFREAQQMAGVEEESVTRNTITKAIMSGYSYYDVEIPLLGYHWLDFD